MPEASIIGKFIQQYALPLPDVQPVISNKEDF